MKKILLILFLLGTCITIPQDIRATVSENAARDAYTGNGSSTGFPYTFRILDQSEIAVYTNGVLKTLTTDYSVSGVGNAAGGTITFVVAPTNGHQVLFLRASDITQASIYTPNEAFPATRVERDLDRQTMVNQQQQEELNRAIKLNLTQSGITTSFTPEAGKCFGLNVGGTAVTNFDCEGGGGAGDGDITDVLGTSNEITVTNPGGPSPQVGIASSLNLSTKVLQGGSPLVFEGATDNAFETTVTVTDPTADRTFTIPDAASVAVQPSTAGANQFANGVSAAGVVAYQQPAFTDISGTSTRSQIPSQVAYEDETNTWSGNNTFLDENGLKIVDDADNTRVGRFSAGNITSAATRTMSFPNLSGTIALADTAQTISGANTFSADQTFATGARAILGNLGLRGTASDTNPACGAGDYTVYADLSEGKWKRCDNGVLSDLGSSGGSDGQHQIDSVNVSTNDPINFQDTATIDWTNPSAGNIQAAIKATSVTDAMIAAAGITTRSKLPTEVAYDDEANVFTNTQSFTTPLDIRGGTAIVFEGATANDFETSLVITDPTADRTVTIPNASGEVSLLGQTISGAEMDNNTVGPTQIDETAAFTWTGGHDFTGGTLTGALVGNASTATAGAANGANCSAGNAFLGVDTAWAAEGCFDVVTQAEADAVDFIVGTSTANLGAERVATDTATIDVDIGTAAQAKWNVIAESITATHILETDDYSFSGTVFPSGVLSSLPAAGTEGRFFRVTDCESTTACSVGSGIIRILHHDDGTSWIPMFSTALASNLSSVMAAGNTYYGADCTSTKALIVGDSVTDSIWICHDATDGLRVMPVVGGVPDAGDKTTWIRDGYSYCLKNKGTGANLFCINGTTGTISGASVKKTVEVIPFGFTTDVATGDGKFYFRVPTTLDGYSLSNVKTNVITAGTTNVTTVGIDRCAATTSGNVCSGTVTDMLATGYSIDSGENSSSDAATPGALSATAANLVVTAGQIIRINVDAVTTTAPKGLIVEMELTAP